MLWNLIAPSCSSHETVLLNSFLWSCSCFVWSIYIQHIAILLLKVNGIVIYCQNLTGMQSLVSLFGCGVWAREVALWVFREPLGYSRMPKNASRLIFRVSTLKLLHFFSMAGFFLTPILFYPKLSRSPVRPNQPRIQEVPGFISGVKRLGREVNHRPPSSA
jgi:hypothetical protein